MSGWPLEFVSEEKPVYCRRYQPRKEEGIFALIQRAIFAAALQGPSRGRLTGLETVSVAVRSGKAPAGYVGYDNYFNDFDPMTLAEIEELRKQHPDKPNRFQRGKNPMSMSVEDIAKNPVGMLKPGEQMPGTLSPESEKVLGDIFGTDDDGGILKK